MQTLASALAQGGQEWLMQTLGNAVAGGFARAPTAVQAWCVAGTPLVGGRLGGEGDFPVVSAVVAWGGDPPATAAELE